jgi:hypothetical protein
MPKCDMCIPTFGQILGEEKKPVLLSPTFEKTGIINHVIPNNAKFQLSCV